MDSGVASYVGARGDNSPPPPTFYLTFLEFNADGEDVFRSKKWGEVYRISFHILLVTDATADDACVATNRLTQTKTRKLQLEPLSREDIAIEPFKHATIT